MINGFIGTYTSNESKGIYSFYIENDKIKSLSLSIKIENPTYIVKKGDFLFSTCSKNIDGELYGGIASFKILKDNTLQFINSRLLKGKSPCHIYIDENIKNIFSSNYHKNEIIHHKIENGMLSGEFSIASHDYNGDFISPQEKPHIHYGELHENTFYSLDLGTDTLSAHKFLNECLDPSPFMELKFKKGTGPRHMVTCPKTKYSYILSELSGEIFKVKLENDSFKILSILKLVEDSNISPSGGAIRLHPNSNFLYASERGENKLHLIYIDGNSLTKVKSYSTYGDGPRDFNISKDGNYLLCGNQNSNNLSLYKIDKTAGFLTFLQSIEAKTPVSIEFI